MATKEVLQEGTVAKPEAKSTSTFAELMITCDTSQIAFARSISIGVSGSFNASSVSKR
jgi:hypothetical protein